MTITPANLEHEMGTGAVLAAIWLTVAGAAGFLVMPVLLGAAVIDLGLDEKQVGYMGAAVLAGSAISAVFAAAVVRNVSWRWIAVTGLGLQVTGLLISTLIDGFNLVMIPITIASLGGGITYSLALTVLSDHRAAPRLFGFSVASQVSFQVLGMLSLPLFMMPGGFDDCLILLGLIAFLGLPVVPLLPGGSRSQTEYAHLSAAQILAQPRGLMALFGCLFFFLNIGALWAYIERIGSLAGFDPATLGQVMAAGIAMGIVGSLTAAWQSHRMGLALPLGLSTAGTVLGLFLLTEPDSVALFLAGFGLFNFVWNYSLTYQYATVAETDNSGRFLAATPAFHGLGGAAGPAIAATYVSPGDLSAVTVIAGIAVVLSLGALLPAALGHRPLAPG